MISDEQRRRGRFWMKFLRLTRGRVPVLRALGVIAEEECDVGFKAIVTDLQSTVDAGSPLSEGLAKHTVEFSASVRELIRTAERTGAWDEILAEIADGLAEGTFE